MSFSTRQRFPFPFAIFQLALRICILGTAITALCFLVKLAITYNHQGKTFGAAITASAFAVFISIIESVTLLNHTHRIKRAPTIVTGVADLIVFGFGFYSIFEILLSDLSLDDAPEGYPTPWENLQSIALLLMIIIVVESGIAVLLMCCCGCTERIKIRTPAPQRATTDQHTHGRGCI